MRSAGLPSPVGCQTMRVLLVEDDAPSRRAARLDLHELTRFSMKIRAGYEISYDCPQPTPMILTLSVHPSRFDDLLTPDRVRLDPPVPAHTYHDNSGNFCHVIRAPAGRFTMSTDFLVKDSGEPDAVAPGAQQHALEDLPKTCRWRSWSICSVAATARPIAYRIRHGPLVSFRRV